MFNKKTKYNTYMPGHCCFLLRWDLYIVLLQKHVFINSTTYNYVLLSYHYIHSHNTIKMSKV